jgi:hypothetical protein
VVCSLRQSDIGEREENIMVKENKTSEFVEFEMIEFEVERADILEDPVAPSWGVFCVGKACTKDSWGVICG